MSARKLKDMSKLGRGMRMNGFKRAGRDRIVYQTVEYVFVC